MWSNRRSLQNVKRINLLVDFLRGLNALSENGWLLTHDVKWGHKYLNKPEWVNRDSLEKIRRTKNV